MSLYIEKFLKTSNYLQVKKEEDVLVDMAAETRSDGEEDKQKARKTPVSLQEAQRCMSLYFALCTKVICICE